MSVGGGCEAAVTARTRCWWVKIIECRELLCGKRIHLKLKLAVYNNFVRPTIPYGSGARCLKEIQEFYKGQKDSW